MILDVLLSCLNMVINGLVALVWHMIRPLVLTVFKQKNGTFSAKVILKINKNYAHDTLRALQTFLIVFFFPLVLFSFFAPVEMIPKTNCILRSPCFFSTNRRWMSRTYVYPSAFLERTISQLASVNKDLETWTLSAFSSISRWILDRSRVF